MCTVYLTNVLTEDEQEICHEQFKIRPFRRRRGLEVGTEEEGAPRRAVIFDHLTVSSLPSRYRSIEVYELQTTNAEELNANGKLRITVGSRNRFIKW